MTNQPSESLKTLKQKRDAYERVLESDEALVKHLDSEWHLNETQKKLANMPKSIRKRAGLRIPITEKPPEWTSDFLINRRDLFTGRLNAIKREIKAIEDNEKQDDAGGES